MALCVGGALLGACGGKPAPRPVRPSRPAPAYLPAPKSAKGYEVSWRAPSQNEVTRLGPVYAPSHQCPVPIGRLVVLEPTFLDLNGAPRRGTILVARAKAETLGRAFGELYSAGFRIERMDIWAAWWARLDPAAGELVNNTVGFSCRKLQSGSWSRHSFGEAIDINPVINPYSHRKYVFPKHPTIDYTQRRTRGKARVGEVAPYGPVTSAFWRLRWNWGGDWLTTKDWMHFSAPNATGVELIEHDEHDEVGQPEWQPKRQVGAVSAG
ncbi:hypothetical protein BN381_10255 [Candidatus Microthrix parvicella RN1]|uniref:Peptidase M15C domain-containing protein n=3 Tax=Candidatus Neomicrothrix TaxID=41949 RepID=R4YVK5_9ACTN|nr:hypothetical protein BN381_10255 [Candidatus Microthrix parvicella RN1]